MTEKRKATALHISTRLVLLIFNSLLVLHIFIYFICLLNAKALYTLWLSGIVSKALFIKNNLSNSAWNTMPIQTVTIKLVLIPNTREQILEYKYQSQINCQLSTHGHKKEKNV